MGQFLSKMKDKLSIDPLAPTNVRQTTYAPDSLPTTGTDNRALTPEEVRKLQISGGREQIGANENWGQTNAAPGEKPEVKKYPKTLNTEAGLPSINAAANSIMGVNKFLTPTNETDAINRFKSNINTSAEGAPDKITFLKELSDISKPAFDKATDMVEKEKSRLKSSKDEDFYMALIEGGLAAAGETGPNALQNIAKGFSKGASSYREGIKDLRKATQENAKMEVDIERAKAADKKGDVKSFYEHQEKAYDRKAKVDDRIAAGISSIINTTEHGKYSLAQADISGRYHVAGAGAASRAQQNLMEALGNAEPDSALRKGFNSNSLL
jgi:hypothetical protein